MSIICFSFSVLFKGSPDFEFLMLSCKSFTNNPDFYLSLFYRPPSSNPLLLDTLFSTFCTFNPSVFNNFCKVGDFNVNYLLPTTPLFNKLSSIMSSFCLSQIVSEPTRIVNSTSTLIDLAFTSTHRMVQLCETIPPLANSDHLGIHLILSIKLHKNNIQKPKNMAIQSSKF